ncbi:MULTISPECIES: potassium channel family protein [Ruminococcus]|uniref:Trk system potassium uptake protein TrkA n=1 Tax=Ruminococcus flavefaciens TaxID=1265 RepID=A0A1M7IAC3_RUMFL|nr:MULTISPECIES: TrkA family potassium uptake protein [Ruminococcus]MCR4793868.1 TrkA family potassium uptake protein [Ruminococcus sp.]SHM37670.1 trk system potassium uptake protein TrkA [Ruminococcus flavefaciens]
MKSVLIIGAGQFGIHIARRMAESRCEIMVVDSEEERINTILPLVTNAQIGDSTNADFMRSLGIPDYDVCIVTISDSFQDSLETTALLKELGARKVISRAQNDVQEKFLLRNGADETVYPEKQTAIRLATKEASDDILDVFQLDHDINIYEVRVPKAWNERTIAELDIRKKHHLNIIAVRKSNQLVVPMPDMMLSIDDAILLLGNMKDIQKTF